MLLLFVTSSNLLCMRQFLRIITIGMLLFNAAAAIYGGAALMIRPSGAYLQLSLSWLQHSPFRDYFIPGLFLFVFNGISSVLVAFAVYKSYKHYPALVTLQGALLTAWILVQVWMLQLVSNLHYIYGALGIALIGCGLFLWQRKKPAV